jgi:hypothetical protein
VKCQAGLGTAPQREPRPSSSATAFWKSVATGAAKAFLGAFEICLVKLYPCGPKDQTCVDHFESLGDILAYTMLVLVEDLDRPNVLLDTPGNQDEFVPAISKLPRNISQG